MSIPSAGDAPFSSKNSKTPSCPCLIATIRGVKPFDSLTFAPWVTRRMAIQESLSDAAWQSGVESYLVSESTAAPFARRSAAKGSDDRLTAWWSGVSPLSFLGSTLARAPVTEDSFQSDLSKLRKTVPYPPSPK